MHDGQLLQIRCQLFLFFVAIDSIQLIIHRWQWDAKMTTGLLQYCDWVVC